MPPKKEKKEVESVERKSRGSSNTANCDVSVDSKWKLNDRVLCIFPPESTYKYDAKILQVGNKNGEPTYLVHYQV